MKKHVRKISIIGDGGWGTTLAVHLATKGFAVDLWGPFPAYVNEMQKKRSNPKFLPGIRIPSNVSIVSDLKQTLEQADIIVLATPSQYLQGVLKKIKFSHADLSNKVFLSVIKGIDTRRFYRMSEIIHQELGRNIHLAVLSGPTIAMELAQGIATTAVIASRNPRVANQLQNIFNSTTFRIYTNRDVAGVELGGSLKNVIAIACGACDGLGLGTNTKAAILTRGLAEMARLGKAMGANVDTFYGLSGLGDLTTTCFSPRSRNRTVGEQLGKGKNIRQILSHMEMVAEGVATVKAVVQLSRKYRIPMPISTEVYNIIYKKKKAKQALADLMTRQTKPE
ncbi:MAG: NAD(P)H-dependent glycerol-3-phosphate dehydrogenase [Candidatus Omnitrophota bacterium]|nr:NAD(P)H-dependent glycerol-3-phosphate dehydrogenase [Candidatus Omnitrophota bacterium]